MTGVVELLAAAAVVLLYLVFAVVAVVLAVGIPVAAGKLVYDRAEQEDLANPAMVGVVIAFFTALVGLSVVGTLLVWVGG